MKIPKQVKIGGFIFEVHILSEWPGRTVGGHDGEIFKTKEEGHRIYIGAELTEQAQEATLIHEMLHAMNTTMDHEFLDSLAEQIYQALHDNKLLAV